MGVPTPVPGALLGHYRILQQIGAGGFGLVYRAHDERLDRDVALKVLSPGIVIDSAARKRFHKEALALSRLNHPNIATVHDFDTYDGTDFLVEEFIEGFSLDAMLTSGPLPEKDVINLGSQLADGLAAAHKRGIVHRDLKPGNVRVTPDMRLKILDFGLAMVLHLESSPTAVTESLSENKATAGTLPYMAPEQLLGTKLDGRTDIWGTGCVLYEMAAGRRPFPGSGAALTDAILHQSPTPIGEVNTKISAALNLVIQKCLDKAPERRYHYAKELSVDLHRVAVSVPMPSKRYAPRKLWFAVLPIAVAVVIGVSMEWSLRRSSPKKEAGRVAQQEQAAPHESYLAGMKYLERWDRPSNLESAIGLFEQAVKADPSFALGFSALAEAYWAKYRLDHNSHWIDEAERNCKRAAELNDHLPAVYVTLARVHNGKGQYNLALQEVQQALKLEPHDPDALLSEAAVYASMGRDDEAESTYKKAATLRPQNWDGYYELGVFYFRQRRYADAAAKFERVLGITPDNAIAHATLGGMMLLLKTDDEAEKHLKRSIELQPSYAAFTNLGVLYYRQRRWAESVAMTQKALDINASDWRGWSNLGLAYDWMGHEGEADDAFRNELTRVEEIAKVSTDDAEIQVELGLLYSKWKLREKAVPHIEAALARAPDDPAVLSSAGEAYDNLGDRNIALELVKKSLAKGWTLAQLENDPGKRKLLRDPRFQEITQQFKAEASAAR